MWVVRRVCTCMGVVQSNFIENNKMSSSGVSEIDLHPEWLEPVYKPLNLTIGYIGEHCNNKNTTSMAGGQSLKCTNHECETRVISCTLDKDISDFTLG